MAVLIGPNELSQGRAANYNAEGNASATRTWRVITDTMTDPHTTLSGLTGIPFIGEPHPNDPYLFCRDLSVENDAEDGRVWIITAQYGTLQRFTNPVADPAIITWGFETFQTPAIQDRNGNGIGNSAGELFDPPAMRDDSRPRVTIRKNFQAVPTFILNYKDAVNSDTFTITGITAAPRVAKIQSISVSEQKVRSNIPFYTVEFGIHFNADTWDIVLMDRGYHEIDRATGKVIKIMDDGGGLVPQPWPLDGAGHKIPGASLSLNSIQFQSFRVYPELTFSGVIPVT